VVYRWLDGVPIDIHSPHFIRFRPIPNAFRKQPFFDPFGPCVPQDITHSKHLGTDEYLYYGLPSLLSKRTNYSEKKAWNAFDKAYNSLTSYPGYLGMHIW